MKAFKVKKSLIISVSAWALLVAVLAVLTHVLNASWLTFCYVSLMLAGMVLNGERLREGMLLYSCASAVYLIIAFGQRFYGDFILNACFVISYVVTYALSFKEKKWNIKTLKPYWYAILLGIIAATTPAYYFLLEHIGTEQALLNSLSTTLTVTAVVLTMNKNIEQYIVWVMVNVVQIILWSTTMVGGNLSFIFFIVYNTICPIVNVVNLIKWIKQLKKQKKENERDGEQGE